MALRFRRDARWRAGGSDPAAVLSDLVRRKATGRLRVSTPEGHADIYLLFGHVYHAEGREGEAEGEGEGAQMVVRDGEQVVVDVLRSGQRAIAIDFDSRCRMPTVETVRGDTAALIARAPH